jgi:LmbE family N-acetylglucosaminyl deacetylase
MVKILLEAPVKPSFCAALTAVLLCVSSGEGAPSATLKTLVLIMAHPDDESPVAPILSRYAREGVQVHLIIATDGAQGAAHTAIPGGPELARVRADEARCATDALGIHPPILLGFPDGHLGTFTEDRDRLFQLTARVQAELERLRPDALITWGPDGGAGHPDHRLVSSIATQLVRAGAPGAPERLFYASLPVDGMRVVNPSRAKMPFLIPLPRFLNIVIPYTTADLKATRRAMACHKTQYSDDVVQKVFDAMRGAQKELRLSSLFPMAATRDLFGK